MTLLSEKVESFVNLHVQIQRKFALLDSVEDGDQVREALEEKVKVLENQLQVTRTKLTDADVAA